MLRQFDEAMVDILMPTYRPDKSLLFRAIKSIQAQSFPHWNLVIIENGDRSITEGFIESFNDDRVKYFHLEEKGKPNALNFALAMTNSKYIAYLDDDDLWFANHLEDAVSELEILKCGFVVTDAYEVFIEKDGQTHKEIGRRNLSRGIITEKTLWYISHINIVHTRELCVAAGPYDVQRTFFIDWDMLQRMAAIEKPHYLHKYTCEHFIFLDKKLNKVNTISSQHIQDTAMSESMHDEMFKHALKLVTPNDFLDIVNELRRLNRQVRAFEKTQENLQSSISDLRIQIESLKNSFSWKITQPLRSACDLLKPYIGWRR